MDYEKNEDKVWMVHWDERRKRMVVNHMSEMMITNFRAFLERDFRRPTWCPIAYAPSKIEAYDLANELLDLRFGYRPKPQPNTQAHKCPKCSEEDDTRPKRLYRW
jgi:hypothetical protein